MYNHKNDKYYSISFYDFYRSHSFVFVIFYKGYFYFEPNDLYVFDRNYFEQNLYGHTVDLTRDRCDCYDEILDAIESFYPLDDFIKVTGL